MKENKTRRGTKGGKPETSRAVPFTRAFCTGELHSISNLLTRLDDHRESSMMIELIECHAAGRPRLNEFVQILDNATFSGGSYAIILPYS